MSIQIACKNVSLGYEGSIVTQDLCFSVSSGDYLYILGENGSGKSTLVKALLGLKPQISGEITRGEGVAAGQIGYLPQQTVVQRDFPASVREIVMSGCLSKSGLRPFYTAAERASANAAMERLGITGLAKRCYRELSGGQQQRVLSHDVGAAMRYASHILHIGSHKQLFFGTAEDYAKSSVGRTFIASEEAENDD